MNLFSKKNKDTEDFEDYSTLTLPFVTNEIINEHAKQKLDEPEITDSGEHDTTHNAEEITVYPGGVSPLEALKNKMSLEVSDEPTPVVEEKTEEESKPETQKPVERVSLLKRCMPYIYDENGISQVDTKPDYVLESVDDIIRSAEKRANEKIAQRYKLTDKTGKTVKIERVETPDSKTAEKSIVKADTTKEITVEKISLPTRADILFDDFNSKRTEVTPTENISTAYSKLTDLHTGIQSLSDSPTITMPAVKPEKTSVMEDIISHTHPVNIKDAPALKPNKPVSVNVVNDDVIPEVDDDYRTPEDASRIGLKLKRNRRSAFTRLLICTLTTIASAVFTFIVPSGVFGKLSFLPSIIQFGLLVISALANIGIFSAFKNIFTKNSASAAPIALSITATTLYVIFGLITGSYVSEPVLLSLIALWVYDLFLYKHATNVLNNFKIVASKPEKKAVALIDDQPIATSMARSSIEGEVLAAGVKRASILTDFMRYSSCDHAFGGYLGSVMTVFSILIAVSSLIIGISYHSFETALCVIAVMLSLFAMPTYTIAEYMPLSSLCDRLFKQRAMICSKYSASRIEQANAVVISSNELFPEGSIELFNIKPLGANNIDTTLSAAASVAEAIKSPLVSIFNSFVDSSEKRPVADTVKYEDNLGISGWVKDEHYFIGNRTLMEAHGIKVPPLEIDRKILHKGYFPIYVAVGQRACALLIVKYNPIVSVRNNLVKLINSGITLLIDNCDCNITAKMLSDYYGLYEDSIKVMDHKGVHNYQTAVNYSECYSAHAAHIGKPESFFSIITGALKLRTVSNVMYSAHIILCALTLTVFVLSALDGRMALLSIAACLVAEIISIAISLIAYLFSK